MKKPTTRYIACLFASACLLVPLRVNADILASYDFTGEDGAQSTTAVGSTFANISASSISRGASYDPTAASSFSSDGMLASPGNVDENAVFLSNYTLATAVAQDGYFELTLTVAPGFAMSIDSIDLAVRRASNKSGPNFFGVRSSLDSYTADLASGINNAGTAAAPVDQTASFGSSLQNITGSTTLRLYGYARNESSASYGLWVISNNSVDGAFVVNGTVTAVPEPSVTFLLGFGVLGLVVLRKWKAKIAA